MTRSWGSLSCPALPLAVDKPPERMQLSGSQITGRAHGCGHRIRLGHESLDVALAYLKGKDAESVEAQEHANGSSFALYA
jgi:hypothetical protein